MTQPSSMHSAMLPQHTAMLRASAISEEVAEARGYRSIERPSDLRRLGFGVSQAHVPTLLVPIWGVNGEIALYHHRPDAPRIRDGKPAKYEFVAGKCMAVDVHPFLTKKVRDPAIPLIITEGVKKADAGITAGLCCVAVIGTWNWRGTNEWSGKSALPDWDGIAFKGKIKDRKDAPRLVYVCYDSDVMTKPQVHQALARLSAFLRLRGAEVVYIYLPHGEDGRKVGLDDYLAAGRTSHDLLALATPALREPPKDAEDAAEPLYEETAAGLVWRRPTQHGSAAVPLTNFTARIVADVTEDDGAETRRLLEIEARRAGGCARFCVPAAAFPAMSWPLEHLGASAILYPGLSVKDNARVAIQTLSGEVSRREVYAHTGWRQVGGRWAYLHAGGAVGLAAEEGADEGAGGGGDGAAQVRLPDALERFRLPAPPTGDALRAALRASLALWNRLPEAVAVPLLAAVYRAALGTCDFSLHLAGPSGAFKSEAAALAQQHFGAGLDARHLPGSWASTDNALEGLAFAVKDGLIVIDDFAPTGTAQDVQRLHQKADRLFRGQGNNAGRLRMRADATVKAPKYPRGLILSTGEDVPLGLSLRARLLVLEVAPGVVRPDQLALCQRDAAAGLYAQAMSGFLAAVAAEYDAVQADMKGQLPALRDKAAGGHRRTPEIVANLSLGLHHFLRAAEAAGAITAEEAAHRREWGWKALMGAAAAQESLQDGSEPTRRFVELLAAALASGRAHLASPNGDRPHDAEAWGWRSRATGGEFGGVEWQPLGDRIGWVDAEDVYLLPDAAHKVARNLGENTGDGLVLAPKTLSKRLQERGLLASVGEKRGTNTVRKTLGGQRHVVLHLHTQTLGEKPSPM